MECVAEAREKREQTIIRMLRSLRVRIDHDRADTRQSLAAWIEEAAEEKLARKGKG